MVSESGGGPSDETSQQFPTVRTSSAWDPSASDPWASGPDERPLSESIKAEIDALDVELTRRAAEREAATAKALADLEAELQGRRPTRSDRRLLAHYRARIAASQLPQGEQS